MNTDIKKYTLAGLLMTLSWCGISNAATQTVIAFDPFSATPAPGVWFERDMRLGGTASTVDLTGAGGNLENNQPLPVGAALLTTTFVNGDAANVGLPGVLGQPGNEFPTLELAYSYHKASNPGQNLNAAVALKLEIFNATCDDELSAGDCYGTLVFEPYVNGYGNFPPTDVWTDVVITPNVGGFWWTGGFGQPSSGGGPPYRTLNQWLAIMSSDFTDATVLTMQLGVGTFNPGQLGFFDDVRISHQFGAGLDMVYDFEADPCAPLACFDAAAALSEKNRKHVEKQTDRVRALCAAGKDMCKELEKLLDVIDRARHHASPADVPILDALEACTEALLADC